MQWLGLKTHVEWIIHPYESYTKWYTAIICSWWAYGSVITLLPPALLSKNSEFGWKPGSQLGQKSCNCEMIEAQDPCRMDHTSIWDICKVVENDYMQWIGVCISHHSITTTSAHPSFWISANNLLDLKPRSQLMKWLMLETRPDPEWTMYPYETYAKCLTMIIWSGWAYVLGITPLPPPELAPDFWIPLKSLVLTWSQTMPLCNDWGWRPTQNGSDIHMRHM